jgi:hypothetical protein
MTDDANRMIARFAAITGTLRHPERLKAALCIEDLAHGWRTAVPQRYAPEILRSIDEAEPIDPRSRGIYRRRFFANAPPITRIK